MKVRTEPSTPNDRLNPEPTSSPPKKKPHTCQQIMVMEGGNENMEADVTMHQDNESIKTKIDQFMEERNELDSEQVFNKKPLHV